MVLSSKFYLHWLLNKVTGSHLKPYWNYNVSVSLCDQFNHKSIRVYSVLAVQRVFFIFISTSEAFIETFSEETVKIIAGEILVSLSGMKPVTYLWGGRDREQMSLPGLSLLENRDFVQQIQFSFNPKPPGSKFTWNYNFNWRYRLCLWCN